MPSVGPHSLFQEHTAHTHDPSFHPRHTARAPTGQPVVGRHDCAPSHRERAAGRGGLRAVQPLAQRRRPHGRDRRDPGVHRPVACRHRRAGGQEADLRQLHPREPVGRPPGAGGPGQGGAGDSAPGPCGRRRGRHAPAHPDRAARPGLSPGLQPHGAAVGVRPLAAPGGLHQAGPVGAGARPAGRADQLRRPPQQGRADRGEGGDRPAVRHGVQPGRAAVPGLLVCPPGPGRDQAAHAVPGQHH